MGTQYDSIDLQLGATETTYTDLGDITAPVGANRITGIAAECAAELGYATEGQIGVAKLEFTGSEELDGIPVSYVQATATGQVFYRPQFIPCNIKITGGITTIACAIKLSVAQTGQTHHGKICLRFE